MMVDIGLKFYSVPSPQTWNFYIKVKNFAPEFIQLYYQDPSMNFMCIWHDGSVGLEFYSARSPPRDVTLR